MFLKSRSTRCAIPMAVFYIHAYNKYYVRRFCGLNRVWAYVWLYGACRNVFSVRSYHVQLTLWASRSSYRVGPSSAVIAAQLCDLAWHWHRWLQTALKWLITSILYLAYAYGLQPHTNCKYKTAIKQSVLSFIRMGIQRWVITPKQVEWRELTFKLFAWLLHSVLSTHPI